MERVKEEATLVEQFTTIMELANQMGFNEHDLTINTIAALRQNIVQALLNTEEGN